ncbi:MAG: VOC family protein [Clostridiales bacterium]|jgi:lactoylglutathione lyase|nr:VOC family protein [Clostridiales bacterium]OPZ67489.1 MAG: Glyoxalase-like domain protein [Firmicutes bacterium ADurb.Bin467]
MKFLWCTIQVKDLAASEAFYREIVGLEVKRRMDGPSGPRIAFLGGEGSEVELIQSDKGEIEIGGDISLGFEVKSLEEKMAFLARKGIPLAAGPFQPNPHVRFFYILDPNGLRIQFVERG